ncbi:MAG: nitrogenase cofactor biosynthesis protein NifB [Geminicoccaceae bacterium]|nr:MAG: nitrogenase cofactor biosynthesis protein NifB [Geminicoccaceae bacterium]
MSAPVIPLESLRVSRAKAAPSACGGCGPSAEADSLPPEIWAKVKDHPCYAEGAHAFFARMHVAVAPACNIQCNYCNRKYDCANESRPGVVSERLTPEAAAAKVVAVARAVPELAVVGIAGPGDAVYDWARTKTTFALVRERLPELTLCLSSNGLAMLEHVDDIAELGIGHVTLTINAIDPAIGAQIYPWIFHQHRRWTGEDAARILLARQVAALEALVARDILVKVNSVLIPGVNDQHLPAVNAFVKAKGAFLHNVMPLISAPEHGTAFGLQGVRGPTAQELAAVQDACGGGARLMRHCRQCRADAIGLLGADRPPDFAGEPETADAPFDHQAREDYRCWVEVERADREAAAAEAALATRTVAAPALKIAVCTKGGGRVNQHFGQATELTIVEVDQAGVRRVGHRRIDNHCVGCTGTEAQLDAAIAVLTDVPIVLCAKIGPVPRRALEAAGLIIIEDDTAPYVETAAAQIYRDHLAGRDAATG